MTEINTERYAVDAAIKLLRTLRYTHSHETSAEVYEALKHVLGNDFMALVLQGLLADRGERIVEIQDIPSDARIAAISLLRAYTRCTMTHATLLVDNVIHNGIRETVPEQPTDTSPYGIDEFVQKLRDDGITCAINPRLTN